MIKDELEYEVTREWADRFQKAISILDRDEELKNKDPERWQIDRGVKECHLIALQSEIDEYERLINCDKSQPIEITVENLNQLPDALIKARIAAKMSQKELADRIGFDEERIKECEKTDYQCANFVELLEVSAALGLDLTTAVIKVDFERIEAGKEIAKKWHESRKKSP